jgi:Na+/H+ antiporter NhaA
MSIFISNLGFENMRQTLLHAKAAILSGSLIAGICGYCGSEIFMNTAIQQTVSIMNMYHHA